MRVNAAEAARLADRSERRVREWIRQGKLRAEPSGPREKGEHIGPSAWSIDTDDLATVPGVTIRRERLAELAAGRDRTPAGLLARVEQLEARVRALEGRQTGARVPSAAVPTAQAHPPDSPYSAPGMDELRSAPGNGGDVDGLKVYMHFVAAHGVNESAAQHHMGKRIPTTDRPAPGGRLNHYLDADQQRAALIFWRDTWKSHDGRTVHRCDDPACVCHELLPE